jgi:hypothetical protein
MRERGGGGARKRKKKEGKNKLECHKTQSVDEEFSNESRHLQQLPSWVQQLPLQFQRTGSIRGRGSKFGSSKTERRANRMTSLPLFCQWWARTGPAQLKQTFLGWF